MQSIQIPQDIIDIMRECHWEHDSRYCEFDRSLAITKEGKILVKDGIGAWANERYAEEMQPEEAWSIIRTWWASEAENRDAQAEKLAIENKIAMLQKDLEKLENTAKKRKWFW